MEGCPARAKNLGILREHFMYRHCKSKVAIFHEVPGTLPRCDQCGLHMPAARIFKHWHSDNCNKATERRLRRRYMDMAESCGEMEFSVYGVEGEERVENVPTSRYWGRPLDQTNDDWLAVQRNIMYARSVWGILGTMIQRKRVEPRVSVIFYSAVVQAILL